MWVICLKLRPAVGLGQIPKPALSGQLVGHNHAELALGREGSRVQEGQGGISTDSVL